MDDLITRTESLRDHEQRNGQSHPKSQALYAAAISGDPKAQQAMVEHFRAVDRMRNLEAKYGY